MLWQFRHRDSQEWSYLFGTMHVNNYEVVSGWDKLPELIEKVDYYYSEINLDLATENLDMQSVFTSENTISTILGDKKYRKIRRVLRKSFHTDILALDALLPFLIVNQLSISLLETNQAQSMDHKLWEIAKTSKKKLGGLESIKSQIAILGTIPWGYQLKQLIDVSKNVKRYRRFVLAMFEAYKMQDVLKLYKMSVESLGKYKNLMLINRNIAMTENILKNKDTISFYAVGAAHLGGYHGMIRLLKQNDFEIVAMTNGNHN